MTQIKTASGRTRRVAPHVDTTTILGLDEDGRVVVQEDWMKKEPDAYAFGLTLPGPGCEGFAWDKGVEDGVVCRRCYGTHDVGNYLFFRDEAGNFVGLDPLVELAVPH